MKRKMFIRISVITMVLCISLFVILVVHVGKVAIANKNDKRIRQLSRIDFKEDINSSQADEIKGYVASLEGVSGVFFNEQAEILTYMYNPALQNSASVFEKVTDHFSFKAEAFRVDENDMSKGCPAFAEKGIFSKFVLYCAGLLYN